MGRAVLRRWLLGLALAGVCAAPVRIAALTQPPDGHGIHVEAFAELSPRQVEVMRLVAEGFSNKEIALKLDISPRTVENYRAWVMEKMGAKNLADLVRKVMILDHGAPPGAS